MDPGAATLLVLAGAAMGFINNLAGAGGLIGLFALDLALGLDTVSANATLRPAAIALTGAGVLGFSSKGQRIPARAWLFGLAAAPGAAAGALMAVTLPGWVYHSALTLVVLTMLAKQIGSRPQSGTPSTPARPRSLLAGFAIFSLVGLHMGFLQVGVGLLTMLALSRSVGSDLVAVNAAKMALLSVTAVTSVACLAPSGEIEWGPALWLALGAGTGSFVGGRFTVRKGHGAVRAVVLTVCVFALLRIAYQLLFASH